MTRFDVFECAINPDLLEEEITQRDTAFEPQYLLIAIDNFLAAQSSESYSIELLH